MTPLTRPAPPSTGPAPPIEAIREAVRAEMVAVHQAAAQTAIRAAAETYVGARLAGAQGLLHAVAALLAVRLLLVLALVGAFVLSVMALNLGTYQAAGVVVAYAVLVLIPLVYLERNPRVAPAVEGVGR